MTPVDVNNPSHATRGTECNSLLHQTQVRDIHSSCCYLQYLHYRLADYTILAATYVLYTISYRCILVKCHTYCQGLSQDFLRMPVQNNYFKISARPDFATYLFQSLFSTSFNRISGL